MPDIQIGELHTISNSDGTWTLTKPLWFKYKSPNGRVVVRTPAGYTSDFFSVPWWARPVISKADVAVEAAVIHDIMCSEKIFSSGLAAEVFKFILLEKGMEPWRAWCAATAVRYRGPQF